ncbi:SKA complex subunit 3 isoform X2 [Mastacembelus armatus]|uniref:SKA complex subunit 3 isoform X2 n=1 Tax=Mastacembelus armatus TaxID=205130 RepID=UPI000E45A855|nr:spindle and kinetochore-associated protein 3 isoform X2 [Mastacembelus armatus]
MDPTSLFFSKLKKLAVTLESETAKLQLDFENRHNDGDGETMAKAMRAYHELYCEVGNLKEQVQDELVQQKAQLDEVSSFVKACRVMEQRVTGDIQTLRTHWEKYGYQAPRKTQTPTKTKSQESEDEVADENEFTSPGEEKGSQEEAEGNYCSLPLKSGPPPSRDVLRTPQLSDFGLSAMHLKRALAGAERWSEVPPMPKMSLPHPSLSTPSPPPMPITPKRALQMNDDELQTPQMNDFGISEHTMCLNNDFTMNLLQKEVEKHQRPAYDIGVPAVSSLSESLQTKDLTTPEPPELCIMGFKIKKTNGHCSPPAAGGGDPDSPARPASLPNSPEVPVFQTPCLNRLVSAKKSAQKLQTINMQADDDFTSDLTTPPHNRTAFEYSVPEISFMGMEEKGMPEMPNLPNLETILGNSLRSRSNKVLKTNGHEKVTTEPTFNSLELDGLTQEFSLRTPHIRREYQEPSTPEMPDLSCLTQDICKLVSRAQVKKTAMVVEQPQVRPEKHKNRVVSLSVVSESEFQSLPRYLRQMTLHSLNQAVHNINKFTAECQEEKTELQIEELKKITNVGTKTPIYVLCLTELKRLKPVEGAGNISMYKLG